MPAGVPPDVRAAAVRAWRMARATRHARRPLFHETTAADALRIIQEGFTRDEPWAWGPPGVVMQTWRRPPPGEGWRRESVPTVFRVAPDGTRTPVGWMPPRAACRPPAALVRVADVPVSLLARYHGPLGPPRALSEQEDGTLVEEDDPTGGFRRAFVVVRIPAAILNRYPRVLDTPWA